MDRSNKGVKMELNEQFTSHIRSLLEAAPPSGAGKRFAEKEDVKRIFQKYYGDRWKRIFYSIAWNIYNGGPHWKHRAGMKKKKVVKEEDNQNFQGTDSLVRKYRNATPGQEIQESEFTLDHKPYVIKYTKDGKVFYKSFASDSEASVFAGKLKQKYGDTVKIEKHRKKKLRDPSADAERFGGEKEQN